MPFDVTTLPTIGFATRVADLATIQANCRYLAPATAGVVLWSGGNLDVFMDSVTFVDSPMSGGSAGMAIDGTYLGYASVFIDMVLLRDATQNAISMTAYWQLWNVTDSAQVGATGSLSIGATYDPIAIVTPITLPALNKRYSIRYANDSAYHGFSAFAQIKAKGI